MTLKRNIVFGLNHLCCAGQRRCRVAHHIRPASGRGFAARMYLNKSSDAGKGAVAGFCQLTFSRRPR